MCVCVCVCVCVCDDDDDEDNEDDKDDDLRDGCGGHKGGTRKKDKSQGVLEVCPFIRVQVEG